MGDLKNGETFIDCVFITPSTSNVGQIGLVPTCTFVKASDGTRTAGTVVEIGLGWYKCTDFASNADGTWLTEWAVVGNYTIHYPFKEFKVGGGVIADLERTREQKGTQATTNALAVVGAAITSTIPFVVEAYISLNNMVAGDTFLVLEEIRDQDDATYRELGRTTFYDAQTSPMVWFEPKTCMGWRASIQRTSGADRNITYQYFTR